MRTTEFTKLQKLRDSEIKSTDNRLLNVSRGIFKLIKFRQITNYKIKDMVRDIYNINDDKEVKVCLDDFVYLSKVNKKTLSSLEMIWGNCNIEKLHDARCLKSLNNIWGDLRISTLKNEENLNNLEIVYGDIYTEELLSNFANLKYLGGKIHFNDKSYTLDEYKNLFC